MLIFIGAFLVTVLFNVDGIVKILVGVGATFLFGYAIWWGVSTIQDNKATGVYDAIGKAGIAYWEKKATRLGMIKGEETKTRETQ